MKFPNSKKRVSMVTSLVLVLALCSTIFFVYAAKIPKKQELASGVVTYSNAKAAIDASNLNLGLVNIKYTGGKNVAIRVQIAKSGGTTYTYTLNKNGNYETFALTEGGGSYTIKVFENTTGTKYAQAFSQSVTMNLDNEFSPYLYPNQYVNFSSSSKVTAKAAELTSGKSNDVDKLTAIYDFVINNFTYDTKLADTVTSGYLPNVDSVLASKKGICFDYAAVMAAMLRSQNIPCKLVVGYAGTVYHAWINVYTEETGWVEKAVFFDGKNWSLMDPTFASTGKGDPAVAKYIGDGSNYSQKFAY